MVNREDFAQRLQQIIEYYDESASSFSEKIGVQRSSISHILSGRNKPSLDFVLKVLSSYPEVELYWLLNGKGSFPSGISNSDKMDSNTINVTKVAQKSAHQNKKEIKRIVIFYADGSFEDFEK